MQHNLSFARLYVWHYEEVESILQTKVKEFAQARMASLKAPL